MREKKEVVPAPAGAATPVASTPWRGLRLGDFERVWIAVLAVLIGMVVGALFVLWSGKNPLVAYQALWQASFANWSSFGEMLVNVTPLIFTGLAIAFAFRAGLFNIGAEGQFIVGQIAAAWAGYAFTGLPAVLHVTLALLAGFLAGALWAAVPAYLKAKRGVHEVINTIMMNYIALYFTHFLVNGVLRGHPYLPVTKEILPTARLFRFLPNALIAESSRVNAGFLVALACALLVYYLMWKTTVGYEIRAVGLNPTAAEYRGISVAKNLILAMLVSGGLAGIGGAVQVLGIQYKFYDIFSFTNYGFDGIAVALIGNNHPAGVLGGALLFGFLARGGTAMQSIAEVPKEIINIIQAAIIIFVAADMMIRRLFRLKRKGVTDGALE
ncbi:MAG: ABC transporter permease [Firmicutes bacterium]|nr:ABC transporter permease [Bacillota bacterium]